jgi:K+-transporting ATPase A subunit
MLLFQVMRNFVKSIERLWKSIESFIDRATFEVDRSNQHWRHYLEKFSSRNFFAKKIIFGPNL